MNLNNFTLSQLLLAAGKARGMNTASLCKYVNCSEAYLYKLLKNKDFLKIVEQMKGLDVDSDNVLFVNIGTLYADIGKYLYNNGIKTIINGENND